MNIGDINVPLTLLDLEHRMLVMEQLIQYVVDHNQNLNLPNQSQYDSFKDKAIETLKTKYPSMGITKKQ